MTLVVPNFVFQDLLFSSKINHISQFHYSHVDPVPEISVRAKTSNFPLREQCQELQLDTHNEVTPCRSSRNRRPLNRFGILTPQTSLDVTLNTISISNSYAQAAS